MSLQTASVTRRQLVKGVALIGCALATCSPAAATGNPPLQFSSVYAATAIVNLGSTTGTTSFSGPSTYVYSNMTISAGSGVGAATAFNAGTGLFPGYSLDSFGASLVTTNFYSAGIWSVTFDVLVSQTAMFTDMAFLGFTAASWTVDSVAVVNGDTINAGRHVFTGTFLYSGSSINLLQSAFGLAVPATGAVPLPGAAGLAACGLFGLGRRRRR